MQERVTVSVNGGVADVRLNRPEKLNGLDRAMFEAIVATGRRLARERSVRAVVLSGAGRAFCAGLDFSSFLADAGGEPGGRLLQRQPGEAANFAQQAAWVWNSMPVPVVAALHGAVFGGGLQIALGADIRLVAPDAQLSVMEIRWGLVPDMTGTQTMRHLVRLDVMKDLTFTGRIVSGTEAVELGLATRVSQHPHDEALALARDIAARSPDAIRAAKRLLNAAVTAAPADGLALEERLQRRVMAAPNHQEAIRANMERRPPAFADPSEEQA